MAELHLESVPENLLCRLEKLAAADQVPLAEEVLRLLHEVVGQKQIANGGLRTGRSQREILDDISRHRYQPAPGTPDSVELLREDRNR